MRILFYGDRNWSNQYLIGEIMLYCMSQHESFTLIHGGAPGADQMSGNIAHAFCMPVEVFPAHWQHTETCPIGCNRVQGKRAGPERNKQMLNSTIDLAYGFHDDIVSSKGTKHMKSLLDKAGVTNYLISNHTLPFHIQSFIYSNNYH